MLSDPNNKYLYVFIQLVSSFMSVSLRVLHSLQ